MIFNPETQNKSSKTHESSEDNETKTPGRKLPKATKQLVPKHLTSCPFLERRGFCML